MREASQPGAGLPRQAIDALVVRIAGVPLDPAPLDRMDLDQIVQHTPQVLVLDRLSALGLPAVGHPALDPLADPLLKIGRVGVQIHRAATVSPLQVGQRGNGRLQLHAVVGRLGIVALENHLAIGKLNEGRPTAGAGVGVAAAVGVDDDRGRSRLDRRIGKTDLSRVLGMLCCHFRPTDVAAWSAEPMPPIIQRRTSIGKSGPVRKPGRFRNRAGSETG